ncbi:MAG: Exodeoxyribonuclease [Alphaproteobacteria bacterium ADurb.Bin438]|nr:MAG: Exodeoxyribonuclease [Alphaproteobacteria bacterium ADurb.Bin438]
MKIASFNVNSITVRLTILKDWLKNFSPDIVLLQELKCVGEKFPYQELKEIGYESLVYGQKAYNGVAILSKHHMNFIKKGMDDTQARFISAEINGVIYASVYVPNGNPKETKLDYKLKFYDWLYEEVNELLQSRKPFLIGGDYNVIIEDSDVYNPKAYRDDALMDENVRKGFKKLVNLGLVNAFKFYQNDNNKYSFWNYRANAFERNHGMLIDHMLLSPSLADKLNNSYVCKDLRGLERPSDHTPLVIEIDI